MGRFYWTVLALTSLILAEETEFKFNVNVMAEPPESLLGAPLVAQPVRSLFEGHSPSPCARAQTLQMIAALMTTGSASSRACPTAANAMGGTSRDGGCW